MLNPFRLGRGATTLVLATLAACADHTPTAAAPLGDGSPAIEAPLAALDCAVNVEAATLACAPTAASSARTNGTAATADGLRLDLTVGGQGTYIRLATAGPQSRDDAAGIVSGPVTVTNLMTQALGTPDGSTVGGVRVFFHQRPTVTQGTGTVEVANPDGFGTFTGASQPYHSYNQVIQPGATSAPKTWQFRVPPTVVEFRFQVYVRAAMPSEQGVLRWTTSSEAVTTRVGSINRVFALSPTEAYAVASGSGGGPSVLRWDGARWTDMRAPAGPSLGGVWASSANDVFAVGNSATILHYDGTSWTDTGAGLEDGYSITGVWGSSPTDVWAIAFSSSVVFHYDGQSWTRTILSVGSFHDIHGSAANDVWVVSNTSSVVYHYDGSAWTRTPLATGSFVQSVNAIWSFSPTNAYAAVSFGSTAPAALMRYDGTSWTQVAALPGNVVDLWGASPTSLFAAGYSPTTGLYAVWRFDGSTWTEVPGTPSALPSPRSISGTSASDLWAVGLDGTISHYDGAAWTVVERGAAYEGMWGSSASDVWAVGYPNLLSHYDGTAWRDVTVPGLDPSVQLRDVWGTSATNVFVVGTNGTILRYDGASWQRMTSGTTEALLGISGSSATDVVAVGTNSTILRFDGATWTAAAKFNVPTGHNLSDVWIAPGGSYGAAIAAGRAAVIERHAGTWSACGTFCNPGNFVYNGVGGTATNDVYLVGDRGVIMYFNGGTWQQRPSGTTNRLLAVSGTSARDHWIVGENGTLLHYSGFPGNWVAMNSGTTRHIRAVRAESPTSAWLAGEGKLLLRGTR